MASIAARRVEVDERRGVPLREREADVRALPGIAAGQRGHPDRQPVGDGGAVAQQHLLGGLAFRRRAASARRGTPRAAPARCGAVPRWSARPAGSSRGRATSCRGAPSASRGSRRRRRAARRCCRCAGRRAAASAVMSSGFRCSGPRCRRTARSPLSARISAATVSPNRSWAMCSGAYCSPSKATNGSTQPSAGLLVSRSPQYALCSRASPRTPLATWSTVIGRVESRGSAPRATTSSMIIRKSRALLVDERRVDRRMVKRQSDSRREQPRLVEQPAGERDELGVGGVDGLGEHRRGPGAGRVGQLEAGPPVGAVVAQRDR